MTKKTSKMKNDIAIGVDVTNEGTHVVAMRMRPDGINVVIYSKFHPLEQPKEKYKMGWPLGDPREFLSSSKRTWIGLTDKEIDEGLCRNNYAMHTAVAWRDGVEWATKKLKERNT